MASYAKPHWDAAKIRALREFLGATQQELSEKLGTRQQTISEWERGLHVPRGSSAKLLSLVVDQARFQYGADISNS